MRVEDVMTSSPAWCTRQTPLEEVAKLMVEHDCGAIPVLASENNKQVVGIVTDRDIVVRYIARGKDPMQLTAEDCMTASPHTVPPDLDLQECCHRMEEHKVRRMPVVDSEGDCKGIISQADIVKHCADQDVAEVVRQVSEPGQTVAAPI